MSGASPGMCWRPGRWSSPSSSSSASPSWRPPAGPRWLPLCWTFLEYWIVSYSSRSQSECKRSVLLLFCCVQKLSLMLMPPARSVFYIYWWLESAYNIKIIPSCRRFGQELYYLLCLSIPYYSMPRYSRYLGLFPALCECTWPRAREQVYVNKLTLRTPIAFQPGVRGQRGNHSNIYIYM